MTTQTKHTAGPWAVSMPGGQTTFNGRRVTVTARGSMVADLDWNTPLENMANARLIAAAPELLEAVNNLLDYVVIPEQRDSGYQAAVEQAEAALAKARGEQS